MPLLRSLTMKIKTKLTPPASPTVVSPTSFEVKRPQVERVDSNSSEESFACIDAAAVDARAVAEALEKVEAQRKEWRRSRFREEF